MKRKLKKYQGKDSGSQATTSKSDSTSRSIDPKFYIDPKKLGSKVTADPKFYINPEKVGGKSGNIDPGFYRDAPKKKKAGGSVKKKK